MGETEQIQKINFKVFEQGNERDHVKQLYAERKFKLIPSVVVHMTLEKEAEIQKMVDMYGSDHLDIESSVIEDLRTEEAKTGQFPIQTPEDEAKWQKKIDEERARFKKPVGGKLTDTVKI